MGKIFYLEMTQFFENFYSKLTYKSLKKIIFGLSHKIADFLVKNGQKTGKFGQKSTTAVPRLT